MKKDMYMRKIAVLFLLFLAGCVREAEFSAGSAGADAILNLSIPGTRASEAPFDENSIVEARLIVYHSGTSAGAKKMVLNTTDFERVNDDKMSCRKIIPSGYINVYLIANETATGIGAALAAIGEYTSESDIENIRLSCGGGINPSAHGITMFRAHKGLKIMPGGTLNGDGVITYADGTPIPPDFGAVERNAVKLKINLVWDKANTMVWNSSGAPVTFESVTLRSMPKTPWLTDGKFYGLDNAADYFDAATYDILPAEITADANSVTAALTFIVPEHIVSDKERRTYLEIDAEWNGSPMTYKLALGEGLGENVVGKNAEMLRGEALLSDYHLVRNTEYTITASIKGKGETDGENVEVHLTALPWVPETVDGDIVNRVLNVSAVSAEFIAPLAARIYFWSNQPGVHVETTGYTGTSGTQTFTVNNFFNTLSGVDAANIHYDDATKSTGYIDISLLESIEVGDHIRRIYLNAGDLRREITVTVTQAKILVPGSNCYMIDNANPETILIPTSRISFALSSGATQQTIKLPYDWLPTDCSTLKAAVLWSDVDAFGDYSGAVVKTVVYNGANNINDGKITVVPGDGTGNAVVILYADNDGTAGYQGNSSDKIYWSWHIWKSDYYPYDENGNADDDWMDRNLGAMANAPTSPSDNVASHGFYYQWGRKDPHPSSNQTNTKLPGREKYFFPEETTGVDFKMTQHSESINNLVDATSMPLTRYWGNTTSYDWYTTQSTTDHKSLWGGESSEGKSVYDPCPEGYRVPKNGAWGNTELTNASELTSAGWIGAVGTPPYEFGQNNATYYGGYYPAAGYRGLDTQALVNVGFTGFYWSATLHNSTTYSYYLYFANIKVVPSNDAQRAYSFSVRCRAE